MRTASSSAAPPASSQASAPLKASPAPVVSTVSTRGAGIRSSASPSTTSAPSAPSVTTTGAPVRSASTRAARSGSSSPASARASSRLGVSSGERSSSSSGSARAGAGLSTTWRSGRACGPRAREHGRVGHLEPEQHDAPGRVAQALLDGAGVGRDDAPGFAQAVLDRPGVELGVGAGGDRDLVLAGLVDHDQRHTGRSALKSHQTRDVDPLRSQETNGFFAEIVVADGAHHPHARPEPRGGNGLVGAFAAAMALERAARHRLARRR